MGNKRIQIVEDENIESLDIQSNLENLGYQISSVARSGKEAVEQAERNLPELILMDIYLDGEMDGISAAAEIRKKIHVPIIYLTAYADDAIIARVKNTNPAGYIVKPVRPEELRSTIEIALYKFEMEEKLRRAEERNAHLKNVLLAIRNVNQLITMEKDRDRLLEQVCTILTETRGYTTAFLAILDKNNIITDFHTTEEDGQNLAESIAEKPDFIARCLASDKTAIFPASTLFPNADDKRPLMLQRLWQQDQCYGILGVSLLRDYAEDSEEQSLFQEVAGDISFALYHMEQEEERYWAETRLAAAKKQYETLFMNAPISIFLADMEGIIRHSNPKVCEELGYSREELSNMPIHHLDPDFKSRKEEINFWDNPHILRGGSLEVFLQHKEGHRIAHELIFSLIDINGDAMILAFARNIQQTVDARRERDEYIAQLHQLSQLQQSLIDNTSVWMNMLDKEANIILWNQAAENISGYSREEVLGNMQIWEWLFPDSSYREELQKLNRDILESAGKSTTKEVIIRAKNGETHQLFMESQATTDQAGNPSGVVTVAWDISRARKTEKRFRLLTETATDIICLHSMDGTIEYLNPAGQKILGLSREDVIGKSVATFLPKEELQKLHERRDARQDGDKGHHIYETRFIHSDGTTFPVEVNSAPVIEEGRPDAILLVIRDISDRKEFEDSLQESLEEKETLLREIHHRVKNNMQVIVSLLNLQSPYFTTSKDRELFQDTENRVRSMALVHEKLYKSESMSRINFQDYTNTLLREIRNAYCPHKTVTVDIDIKDIQLAVDQAIPCALIISELASNACKYAFCGEHRADPEQQPYFRIHLSLESEQYFLSVADNGPGLPEGISPDSTDSLGLKLISILSRQLQGKLELHTKNGAVFEITFPQISK